MNDREGVKVGNHTYKYWAVLTELTRDTYDYLMFQESDDAKDLVPSIEARMQRFLDAMPDWLVEDGKAVFTELLKRLEDKA